MRARRLRGGIGARSQVVTIEDARGVRYRTVLRVYLPREALDQERARREFRTIELARSAGVSAPVPLFLDARGEFFGTPALLLSYLPGLPMYVPRSLASWCEGLVSAMRSIHAVTPERWDMTWLPRFGRDEIAGELGELGLKIEGEDEALAREALRALKANIGRVEWPAPCLIHEDFWPGNTIWYRGRLTGVIDWANARLGDPRIDLAQCCIDALLVKGIEVSDALRDAYVHRAPEVARDLWFVELFVGLKALIYHKIWLIGYRDAGLEQVTSPLARQRLATFVRRALDVAKK